MPHFRKGRVIDKSPNTEFPLLPFLLMLACGAPLIAVVVAEWLGTPIPGAGNALGFVFLAIFGMPFFGLLFLISLVNRRFTSASSRKNSQSRSLGDRLKLLITASLSVGLFLLLSMVYEGEDLFSSLKKGLIASFLCAIIGLPIFLYAVIRKWVLDGIALWISRRIIKDSPESQQPQSTESTIPSSMHTSYQNLNSEANLDNTARNAIEAAFDASNVGNIQQIAGLALGYANVNFKATTDRGVYQVRFCRAQPRERIEDEILFLGSIQKSGYPAAYPIRRNDGDFITEYGDEKVMIYDFIKGETPVVCIQSAGQIGLALGRLSTFPVPEGYRSTPLIDFQDLLDFRDEMRSREEDRSEFFEEFSRQTDALQSHLPFDLPRGFVHGDVFPDNTIFKDGTLAALIDFEDSAIDVLIFDIGMALLGFGYQQEKIDPTLVVAMLRGYQSVRPLSIAEKEALPLVMRWCAHGMAFWHLRHFVKTPNQRQHRRIHELQQLVRGLEGEDGDKLRTVLLS